LRAKRDEGGANNTEPKYGMQHENALDMCLSVLKVGSRNSSLVSGI
jgi:hypothetical protein